MVVHVILGTMSFIDTFVFDLMYWSKRFAQELWSAILHSEGDRHGLLLSCVFSAGCISLLFYFLGPDGYAREVNLLAAASFWMVAVLVQFRHFYTWLCNWSMLTTTVLIAYIATCTGGINSPALVWLTIMVVPALLLLGRRWALGWMVVCVLIFAVEFVGVRQGWIHGDFVRSDLMIAWAFLDKVLMIISLLIAVNFYERTHQRQMHAVEQSNQALEDAKDVLIQTQSHKDEFIASVGHELRTPMNAILGLNGVLQPELADRPDKLQIAQHIRESTEQLLRLVNDILDFSQLEAGRLSLVEKPVHLQSFLRQCVAPFEVRASHKELHLTWHSDFALPAWVSIDPIRLNQLLANLLDNALKFTHVGGINLEVKLAGTMIRFEVKDSGRGIALERQAHIFNRFEHADVHTLRSYGGTGLGLAICEKLVSLHRGSIGVQSAIDRGSLFWFELPLKPAQTQLQPQPIGTLTGFLRFMLVDDNPVNLLVAKLVLQKNWPTASIHTANSGEQALSLFETKRFDVVLMDMVMPNLDGIETTRRIRAHQRAALTDVLVIGLTASHNPVDRLNCLNAGMNEVLVKPIDERALREAIERLLGLGQVEARG